jgi:FkbM family methyltransferase
LNDFIIKVKIFLKIRKIIKNWKIPVLYYFGLRKYEDVIEFKNGVKAIIRNKSDAIAFFEIFFLNTNDYMDEYKIKEKNIVVDVGAHIGYFSIYSSLNAKGGKIFAFEPYAESFEILKRNLEINQIKNVIPQNLAVAKKTGTSSLYLKNNFAIGNTIYKNKNTDKKIDIKTISLKDIIETNNILEIDILKLDCEGAEYDILLNLDNQTIQKINKIVSEMHPNIENFKVENVKDFLSLHGFEVKIVHPLNNVSKELVMLYAKKIN